MENRTASCPASRVLIFGDGDLPLRALHALLERDGWQVDVVQEADRLLAALTASEPSVVLVLFVNDRILRDIRAVSGVPLVVLGKAAEEEAVTALDLGADDYLRLPLHARELLARLRAAARRRGAAEQPPQPVLQHADLVMDLRAHEVTVSGVRVDLSSTEFALLGALLRQPGRVIDRDSLVRAIWGPGHVGDRGVLRTTVWRLRKKLGPAWEALIRAVPGRGYALVTDDPAPSTPAPGASRAAG